MVYNNFRKIARNIMKKAIVLLFLLFLINFAQAKDYANYCSLKTPKKTFGGNIASLSGVNLLTRNVAESIISNAIKNETGSKFKIKINNFYGTNILNGEIKSLKATSKKYAYDGIFLTDINVKTICSYNHVKYENENLYFLENMVLEYSTVLTKEDIRNILISKKIDSKIASILSGFEKYDGIFPILNKMKPISIPIKIDDNTKAKLKISRFEIVEKNLKLNGYIIIPKNK